MRSRVYKKNIYEKSTNKKQMQVQIANNTERVLITTYNKVQLL